MNILLINHYAGGPKYGMAFRSYYMSKEWRKAGHNVLVVGASFSHLRYKQPKVNSQFECETDDSGVEYMWIKTPKYNASLSRIANIIMFVVKLRMFSSEIIKKIKPDLVINSSTYPLDIYPAYYIARKAKAKLCYEAHDIWPLSPMVIGGYSKWHPFIFVMQMAENKACKTCDKLISLLWNSESHYKEHGLAAGKFVCVPNGFYMEEWTNDKFSMHLPSEHAELLGRLNNEGKIIVGFAGGFAASGSLKTLISAAEELKGNNYIGFVLIGGGQEENELKKMVLDNNLQNVHFLPPVSKKIIPAIIAKFDIAYDGGIHSILHLYGTSANKLTDYMLSSKPIIQAIDEPGSIVEKIKCGIRVEAENSHKVAKAITEIANMSKEGRSKMGEKGRKYALANLEYGVLAKKFLDDIFNN